MEHGGRFFNVFKQILYYTFNTLFGQPPNTKEVQGVGKLLA